MRAILSALGRMSYWLGWPALWVYLHGSNRTRVLLVCGDEVLLLRGWISNGEWALPGGGLHKGEDPLTGLVREVQEETGITLLAKQITSLGDGKARQHGFRYDYLAFVCVLSAKPSLSLQKREISHGQWFPLAGIDALRTDTVFKEVLQRWRATA